jgi:hypothetical protein
MKLRNPCRRFVTAAACASLVTGGLTACNPVPDSRPVQYTPSAAPSGLDGRTGTATSAASPTVPAVPSTAPRPGRTPTGGASPTNGGASPTNVPGSAPIDSGVLFDDFSYSSTSDGPFGRMWSVRTERGAPGQQGARWSPSAVGFASSGDVTTMRMTASTDGASSGTVHSEVDSTSQKFFAGTYATRMRFTDAATGPAGAHVYETFFTISPLRYDNDPLYSEMDFEYLPAGGWGDNRRQMDLTTYYTYDDSTGAMDSKTAVKTQSYDGWHTLVMQVGGGIVTYYIDGAQVHRTTGKYYPRQKMNLCFNIWFIDGELGPKGAVRTYEQQVDWVYYAEDRILTPAAVDAQIDAQRRAGTRSLDSVS